jgi:hypothetical protein
MGFSMPPLGLPKAVAGAIPSYIPHPASGHGTSGSTPINHGSSAHKRFRQAMMNPAAVIHRPSSLPVYLSSTLVSTTTLVRQRHSLRCKLLLWSRTKLQFSSLHNLSRLLTTGWNHPQAHFDVDSSMPQVEGAQEFDESLDPALNAGRKADRDKAATKQWHSDQWRSMAQGLAQGLAAGVGGNGNFGESFAAALGAAAPATTGAMHTIEDRRIAEEARASEIEDTFFNRSTKLQELAIARKKAQGEVDNARIGRELQARGIESTDRRSDIAERRLGVLEEHYGNQDRAANTNAGANVVRAKVAQKVAATKGKPKSAKDIDAYARKRVYEQYGATNDNDKRSKIDKLLSSSGRRKNTVQDAYENARREAAKSNVDASEDEDDQE